MTTMTNDLHHDETHPLTDEERHRYEEEWEAWFHSSRDRRCPCCDGNGEAVTMGRSEPEATTCPICRGAPHPAESPRTHRGTLGGYRWHESNWRCETCEGRGKIEDRSTGMPFPDGPPKTCPDCGGYGVRVMPGEGLQAYRERDAEQLIGACEAAIRELEAAQRHDGHAPSTELVLRRLYRALGGRRQKHLPQRRG